MKQHIVRFLHAGCLCLAVSLPSAFAQASQAITVNVPFAFQVNNKQLPAGKYNLTAAAGQPALLIRGVDTRQSMFGLTSPIDSKQIRQYPTLVFTRYGDRYFLSQLWMPGSHTGRGLPASAAEREVAQRWAKSGSTSGAEALAILALPGVGK
jgi:hypothetical protein